MKIFNYLFRYRCIVSDWIGLDESSKISRRDSMFDEVVSHVNLGCKVVPGQNVVVVRFGLEQTRSIVAISQTLDKVSKLES